MMVEWIKSKFRYHQYVNIGMTETLGVKYKCEVCGRKLYLPFDWRFRIDPDKVRGCKGK